MTGEVVDWCATVTDLVPHGSVARSSDGRAETLHHIGEQGIPMCRVGLHTTRLWLPNQKYRSLSPHAAGSRPCRTSSQSSWPKLALDATPSSEHSLLSPRPATPSLLSSPRLAYRMTAPIPVNKTNRSDKLCLPVSWPPAHVYASLCSGTQAGGELAMHSGDAPAHG